jgi:hypothetical protein
LESDGTNKFIVAIFAQGGGSNIITKGSIYIRAYRLPNNNSDLMNKPNLWQPGIEYDFGDGVYGQRFTGTIAAAANTKSTLDISTTLNGSIAYPIDMGGWWQFTNTANNKVPFPHYDTDAYYAAAFFRDVSLRFITLSGGQRTNAPYDIWFLYSKN